MFADVLLQEGTPEDGGDGRTVSGVDLRNVRDRVRVRVKVKHRRQLYDH